MSQHPPNSIDCRLSCPYHPEQKKRDSKLMESVLSASTNTGSPKLPTWEEFQGWWLQQDQVDGDAVYQWFVRQLRAGA